MSESDILALEKFCKENVDKDTSIEHVSIVKGILEEEFKEPSYSFVNFILSHIDKKDVPDDVVCRYSEIIKEAIDMYMGKNVDEMSKEEMEAFYIVRGIATRVFSFDRITSRKVKSYVSVLLDDNNRKPICRLYLGGKKLQIAIPAIPIDVKNKKFITKNIENISEIHTKELGNLLDVCQAYNRLETKRV